MSTTKLYKSNVVNSEQLLEQLEIMHQIIMKKWGKDVFPWRLALSKKYLRAQYKAWQIMQIEQNKELFKGRELYRVQFFKDFFKTVMSMVGWLGFFTVPLFLWGYLQRNLPVWLEWSNYFTVQDHSAFHSFSVFAILVVVGIVISFAFGILIRIFYRMETIHHNLLNLILDLNGIDR